MGQADQLKILIGQPIDGVDEELFHLRRPHALHGMAEAEIGDLAGAFQRPPSAVMMIGVRILW